MKRKIIIESKYDKDSIIWYQDIILSDTQTLRISKKLNGTLAYIDIRKWNKYPNHEELLPTSKGIMFLLSLWPIVKETIDKMANEHIDFESK